MSGKVAPVVIDVAHPNGGWVGANQETNRQVSIKSAQRLRCLSDEYLKHGDGEEGPEAPTAPQGTEKTAGKPEAKTPKKHGPRANTDDGARMSGLDAAARVLEEAGEPLNCKAIVERAFRAGYWQSDGKTPAATIYTAILREIQRKGDGARFRKVERGKFALTT